MIINQTKGSLNTQLFYLDDSYDKLETVVEFYRTHLLKRKTCLVATNKMEQVTRMLKFDYILSPEEILKQNISDSDILILLSLQETKSLIDKLIEGAYPNTLYVSLDHLSHNYDLLNGFYMKGSSKLIPILKANSYGIGSEPIGKHLETLSVPYFGVVHTGEGVALRKSKIKTKIIVMQPQFDFFDRLMEYDLEPVFSSLQKIQAFLNLLDAKKINNYPIHIKLETGMNRTGFLKQEILSLIEFLNKNKEKIQVKTFFSHLTSSDISTLLASEATYNQIEIFENIRQIIGKELVYPVSYHLLNSGGILNFSDYGYDYCRSGIGLYGFVEPENSKQPKLKAIASLEAKIIHIKEIEPKETISYGKTFVAREKIRIATIPIGYADFLGRKWGNEKGSVFINGHRARILGTMCMDLMMVDVTRIGCRENDKVEIFGPNIPLQEMAEASQTIPYEIMTSLNPIRINRVYTANLD